MIVIFVILIIGAITTYFLVKSYNKIDEDTISSQTTQPNISSSSQAVRSISSSQSNISSSSKSNISSSSQPNISSSYQPNISSSSQPNISSSSQPNISSSYQPNISSSSQPNISSSSQPNISSSSQSNISSSSQSNISSSSQPNISSSSQPNISSSSQPPTTQPPTTQPPTTQPPTTKSAIIQSATTQRLTEILDNELSIILFSPLNVIVNLMDPNSKYEPKLPIFYCPELFKNAKPKPLFNYPLQIYNKNCTGTNLGKKWCPDISKNSGICCNNCNFNLTNTCLTSIWYTKFNKYIITFEQAKNIMASQKLVA